MNILLVEDHPALQQLIAGHLHAQGMRVAVAGTGSAALEAAAAGAPDAVILDLGLPDMDGMEVLRRLRAGPGGATAPVLILTARDGVAHRIAGLDGGADDYILKPFDLDEFDARLRAVLRRAGLRFGPLPTFGDLSFDAAERSARAHGRAAELTAREAAVLEALLGQGDRIMVRDALAERVFGAEEVSANALEAIVSRLRRKLAALGSEVRVETMRGMGYRLRHGPAV